MRAIIGLQQPVSGEIEVLGQPTLDGEPEDLRQIRRRWSVLFQAGALFSTLTVAEHVQVPRREYYRLDEALLDDIAAYKLSMAGERSGERRVGQELVSSCESTGSRGH